MRRDSTAGLEGRMARMLRVEPRCAPAQVAGTGRHWQLTMDASFALSRAAPKQVLPLRLLCGVSLPCSLYSNRSSPLTAHLAA